MLSVRLFAQTDRSSLCQRMEGRDGRRGVGYLHTPDEDVSVQRGRRQEFGIGAPGNAVHLGCVVDPILDDNLCGIQEIEKRRIGELN